MGDKDVDELHIRHCMLYEFRQGNNATQTKKNICTVYPGSVTLRQCQRFLNQFKKGDLDWDLSEEKPPTPGGRPTLLDNNDLLEKSSVEKTDPPHQNTKEFAKKHKISFSTTDEDIKKVVKKSKEENSAPRDDQ